MEARTLKNRRYKRFEDVDRKAALALFKSGNSIQFVSVSLGISESKSNKLYAEYLEKLRNTVKITKVNRPIEIHVKRHKEPCYESEEQIEFSLDPFYSIKDLKGDELEILKNLKHKW